MYRCYLLARDGRVQEVREVACTTDAEAELAAREMLRGPRVEQAEVWEDIRLVRRLLRSEAAPGTSETAEEDPAPHGRKP
jgi:hypothetical protein